MPQPAAPIAPVLPAAPVAGAPTTARAIVGLRARRDLLSEQLDQAVERRADLARELMNVEQGGTSTSGRTGLEQRIQVLDVQIVQLERDMATAGQQLAAAPPELLAVSEPPRVVHTGVDDDDVVGISFAAFFVGMLVTLVGGRIRRWRRRGERAAPGTAAAPDPRIDRLSHAVDAIALEVERIGEGQRFVTQLLAEGHNARPALAAEAGQLDGGGAARTLDAPAAR